MMLILASDIYNKWSLWRGEEWASRKFYISIVFDFRLPACVLHRFSRVWLFATPWTVAHQALLCMGFSRQEHWSGLPCPPPGDLPDPGIEPACLLSPASAGGFFTTSATWEALRLPPLPDHPCVCCPQKAWRKEKTGFITTTQKVFDNFDECQ